MWQFCRLLLFNVFFNDLAQEVRSEDPGGSLQRGRRRVLRTGLMEKPNGEKTAEVITISGDGQLFLPGDQIEAVINEDGHANPLGQAPEPSNQYDSRVMQMHPLEEALSLHLSPEMKGNLRHLLMILCLTFGLLFLLAYLMSGMCSEDGQSHLDSKQNKLSSASNSESAWAKAYAEAQDDQKEAFQLLFSCNIIPTAEMSRTLIAQDHIEECVWIATHMLQHKSLEDWVALWQQAQNLRTQRCHIL